MIKKGLDVKILTGKDKNKIGEVIEVDRNNNRVKVKGTNMIKKHVKTTKEKKGGIFQKYNHHDTHLLYLSYKIQLEDLLYFHNLMHSSNYQRKQFFQKMN